MNDESQLPVAEQSKDLIEASRQLTAAQEDLRVAAVAFQTNDSIMITDANGNILQVNNSFSELTGYTSEEVIGKNPRILKSGRHGPEFYSRMWADIQEKGYWEGEIWNKRKDGQVVPLRMAITCAKNESGETTHYVADGQDIRGLRQAMADRMEIDAAKKVQESLVPSGFLCAAGFEIAGEMQSSENVSGDCFDFMHVNQQSVAALIADVSGHGLGPALVMARTQAYFSAMVEILDDPGEILTRVNRFVGISQTGRFVTALLVCLNLETRSLRYASAGHRGWLFRGKGDVEVLESTNVPLGIVMDTTMASAPEIIVAPGDIIVLPTDGIEETTSCDDTQFGHQRILDVVRAHRKRSASEIAQLVLQAARDFAQGQPQYDDMTIVIAKVLATNAP